MSKSCDSSSDSDDESVDVECSNNGSDSEIDSYGIDYRYDNAYEEDEDTIKYFIENEPIPTQDVLRYLKRIKDTGLTKFVVYTFERRRETTPSDLRYGFDGRCVCEYDSIWAHFYRDFTHIKLLHNILDRIENDDEQLDLHLGRLFSQVTKDIESRVINRLTEMSKSEFVPVSNFPRR